jgi:hypothetical protein
MILHVNDQCVSAKYLTELVLFTQLPILGVMSFNIEDKPLADEKQQHVRVLMKWLLFSKLIV